MRIAVVGDTHGHIKEIQKELEALQPECLLFTGDFLSDGRKLASRLALPFYGVAGNCDRSPAETQEKLVRVHNQLVYIVHGHQYGVKQGLMRLYYRAAEVEATIVLFGHTHMPMAEQVNGIWMVNPGSPSNPRGGSEPSYVLMDIEEESVSISIKYL